MSVAMCIVFSVAAVSIVIDSAVAVAVAADVDVDIC